MQSILGAYSPGVSDRSPPTSPPTSVAPQSDDEFTNLVMRRAAQRLGVQFQPQHHHSFNYSSAPLHEENDRTLLRAMSQTLDLPFPGPQTWQLYGKCDIEELSRMIDIRTRALGPRHVSLAPLFDTIGDHYDARGELTVAKANYTAAVDLYANHEQHRAAVLSKIAFVELRLKNVSAFRSVMNDAIRAVDQNATVDLRDGEASAPQTTSSQLLDLLKNESSANLSRRLVAQKLLGQRETLHPDREMAIQTDDVAVSAQPSTSAAAPDPAEHLPRVSLAKMLESTLPVTGTSYHTATGEPGATARNTADLRSLLSYLQHRRSDTTTDDAAATVAAIRKRMYVTDNVLSAKRQVPDITSPSRSVDRLANALRQNRTPAVAARSGEELTQREVARMLLESSSLVGE